MRLLCLLIPALLAGCGSDIPAVDNPHKILVAGREMSQSSFLRQYCQGQVLHPSCVSVSRALVQDSAYRPMPKGW